MKDCALFTVVPQAIADIVLPKGRADANLGDNYVSFSGPFAAVRRRAANVMKDIHPHGRMAMGPHKFGYPGW